MPMPWESTPRRSVPTMSRAVGSTMWGGIPRAPRTRLMNSRRRECCTRTGASCMSNAPLEPGDLDPRVLDLVPAVDGGEHGRDPLDGPRVGEWPDIENPEPHALAEVGDGRLRRGVVAADQEVAVDGMLGGQLVGGDVVERGHHVRLGAQVRLGLLCRRAGRWRGVEARAAEGEGENRGEHG